MAAGMLLTLAAGEWLTLGDWPGWAFSRAGLAVGLALVLLALRLALGWRHAERLSRLPLLVLALGLQTYAWLAAGWNDLAALPASWPVWSVGRALALLVGCGGLANALVALGLRLVMERMAARTPTHLSALTSELAVLHDSAMRLAVVATSLALSLDGLRSWWAYGQLASGSLTWLIVAWLLLVAGAGGRWLMGLGERATLVLSAGALVAALMALLTTTM